MPIYSYKCKGGDGCGHEFDRTLPMSKRKRPTKEPCPDCGADGVEQIIAKGTGSGVISGTSDVPPTANPKVPEGFKDVLRTIKKHSGRGHKIDV